MSDLLQLSGERFVVHYRLRGNEEDARSKAQVICVEQTVEFPLNLVPHGAIRDQIVGQIERFERLGDDLYRATISYAIESSSFELTQLLNVVFGNISLLPGIRVERLELPEGLLGRMRGPRFGKAGLRQQLGIAERPILATALKPMGLSPVALAQQAYTFALGGIDLIKDDHGLANQPFASYRERVVACCEAVARANAESGGQAIYVPNVTAPADQISERAHFARQHGAGGLMIAPGLSGLDSMRMLADDDQLALPIISHPAFQGSYAINPDIGISHFALFGQLARLAGADASIFPNYGGRFSFSRDECVSIVEGCATPMGAIKSIFPAPGGGMQIDRVAELRELYGRDVIFLIGGGLHSYSPDLLENVRYFRRLVESM
jgi:ribulose-bisphosphate carboxylase large chain